MFLMLSDFISTVIFQKIPFLMVKLFDLLPFVQMIFQVSL